MTGAFRLSRSLRDILTERLQFFTLRSMAEILSLKDPESIAIILEKLQTLVSFRNFPLPPGFSNLL
jgi:folate-binding Fe-S cluster repair protein YgfZ